MTHMLTSALAITIFIHSYRKQIKRLPCGGVKVY